MIPLKDSRRAPGFAWGTWALVRGQSVVFVWELRLGPGLDRRDLGNRALAGRDPAPGTVSELAARLPRLVAALFLHGGWLHLLRQHGLPRGLRRRRREPAPAAPLPPALPRQRPRRQRRPDRRQPAVDAAAARRFRGDRRRPRSVSGALPQGPARRRPAARLPRHPDEEPRLPVHPVLVPAAALRRAVGAARCGMAGAAVSPGTPISPASRPARSCSISCAAVERRRRRAPRPAAVLQASLPVEPGQACGSGCARRGRRESP